MRKTAVNALAVMWLVLALLVWWNVKIGWSDTDYCSSSCDSQFSMAIEECQSLYVGDPEASSYCALVAQMQYGLCVSQCQRTNDLIDWQ